MSQTKRTPRTARKYHHGDLRNSLIQAARALLTETDNPDFSLREVAARAGVSHNAPYNHFADKNELLAAVAAAGFDELGESMQKAIKGIADPTAALIKTGGIYATFGIKNPALFRLMWGNEVTAMRRSDPECAVQKSAIAARNVAVDVIRRGAAAGVFTVSPDSEKEIALASLTIWSTIHGLTTLTLGGTYAVWRETDAKVAEKVATMCCYGLLRREPSAS